MRQTSLNMVYELAKRDPRVVFIGSDIAQGTLKKFREEMPERFLMEGVFEANLIGMAAGLAMSGFIPYINTIATFLTRRCFEQIVLDLCLHRQPVRLIGSGGGVVYAPLGPTHLAIEDLAILRALPNMTILAPADAEEMTRLMPCTLDWPGPIYIRLAKGGDPIVTPRDQVFEIGRIYEMRPGADGMFVTTGILLARALQAAETLAGRGLSVGVLHVPTVKPLEGSRILQAAASVRALVVAEEHTVVGGLGSAVAELLAEAGLPRPPRFRRMGLPDAFPEHYGSQEQLLEHFCLSPRHLADTMEGLLAPLDPERTA